MYMRVHVGTVCFYACVCVCVYVHIHGYVFGRGVPVSKCELCLNDRKSLQMWLLYWEEKSFFCEA